MANKVPLKDERVLVQVQITIRSKILMHPESVKTLREAEGGPLDDSQVDIDWQEAMNLDAEVELG